MIRYLKILINVEHIVKVFSHFDDKVFYHLMRIPNELSVERECIEACFFNECRDVNGDPTTCALLQCEFLGGLLMESCCHPPQLLSKCFL